MYGISEIMSFFARLIQKEPVYVEDGVQYYASRGLLMAVRQAEREMRRYARLRRHRFPPLALKTDPARIYGIFEYAGTGEEFKQLKKEGTDLS